MENIIDKQAVIVSLLKYRDEIEEKIRALDPKALIKYELERLTDQKQNETFFTLEETLDMITTFNMSTSYKSVNEAKEEAPQLFKNKRASAKEWVEEHFLPIQN